MKALVLSGGGAKGAHSVGVLQHLLGDLQIDFQIITGVSVGALNGAFLAQFVDGDEIFAARRLKDLWLNIRTHSIYKRHFPFGRWHSLWKNSFYDSGPLHRLIEENISIEKIRASHKKVAVGAISLSSGKYTIFDQKSDDFLKATIASASFPGMFPPVKIGNQLWMDGGLKTISPISTAIDMGAEEIVAIVTSPEVRNPKFISYPSTVDTLKRAFDLSTDKIMSNDIEKVIMYNKLADARLTDKKNVKLTIIRPKVNLMEDFLDFNPTRIKEMIEVGYKDALSMYK